MTRLTASLFLFSLVAVSCNFLVPPVTPPPSNFPDIFKTPWDDRSIFKEGLVPSTQSALDELKGASIYHIELTIEENLFDVRGTLSVQYTNNEDIALDEVHFRLFPNVLGGKMQIANLRAGELTTWPRYALENSLMVVPLAQPMEPGDSIVIHMDFSVTVPQSLDSNYGVLAYADDVLALAHAYPMIAVYNEEGWNAEIPPQTGDVVFADASFYLLRITAPKDVVLVTSGHEISRTEIEQVQILNVASGPARDFYLAASADYEETSETFDGVTIRSYASRYLDDGSRAAVSIAARALEIFNARYGQYPYTELDIVATPTLALGIEYPGIVAITSWIYDGGKDNPYFESTIVHEVGHQWFYGSVGGDQLDDPWLDEALTQFATLQYFADEYGELGKSEFRASLDGSWAQTGNANIPIGLPVAEYSEIEYSAIVYGRGPLFFVELRQEIGDTAFDAFLREYAQSLAWKIATPETLQSLAEKNCTCELDDLFNEWVYP